MSETEDENGPYSIPFNPPWLHPWPPGQASWGGRAEIPVGLLTAISNERSSIAASEECQSTAVLEAYQADMAASFGGIFGIWGAYEEAMVRTKGRKKRQSAWTVEDVLQSIILAAISERTGVRVSNIT